MTTGDSGPATGDDTCSVCNGTGEVGEPFYIGCKACGGTGIPRTETPSPQRVVITFEDLPDGRLEMTMEFNPDAETEGPIKSVAIQAGMECLRVITCQSKDARVGTCVFLPLSELQERYLALETQTRRDIARIALGGDVDTQNQLHGRLTLLGELLRETILRQRKAEQAEKLRQ